jgi:hypothetical protein
VPGRRRSCPTALEVVLEGDHRHVDADAVPGALVDREDGEEVVVLVRDDPGADALGGQRLGEPEQAVELRVLAPQLDGLARGTVGVLEPRTRLLELTARQAELADGTRGVAEPSEEPRDAPLEEAGHREADLLRLQDDGPVETTRHERDREGWRGDTPVAADESSN